MKGRAVAGSEYKPVGPRRDPINIRISHSVILVPRPNIWKYLTYVLQDPYAYVVLLWDPDLNELNDDKS